MAKIKNKYNDEFYSYGPDGAKKVSYNILKRNKKPTLLKKILTIVGIILVLGFIVFVAFLKKKFY